MFWVLLLLVALSKEARREFAVAEEVAAGMVRRVAMDAIAAGFSEDPYTDRKSKSTVVSERKSLEVPIHLLGGPSKESGECQGYRYKCTFYSTVP